MNQSKTIIIGVTGSIAAYKMADAVSRLVKEGHDVYVLMTKNATQFIHPITFETLTGHKALIDTFDRNFNYNIEHVALAKRADALLIAPATANVIGKLANGIADDMLTTTAIACHCPKLIAPAMNTDMYDSPILQDNLNKLKEFDYLVIEPDEGHLACGTDGRGRLPSVDTLLEHLYYALRSDRDLTGKKVLITAGPTREHFDPVRYITNHSTGKMGYAIATAAMRRGAEVTLVSGPTELPDPIRMKTIRVESAAEMFDAVKEHSSDMDILILSAAVADYRPAVYHDQKMKKSDDPKQVELEKTTDILSWLGTHKNNRQFLCGFAMETEDLEARARKKLQDKNADMIIANNLSDTGAGFAVDTNVISVITANDTAQLPLMTKQEDAEEILDAIIRHMS
ncbi:MAG: bifunctional phosphopantothenoylcysteine decarboxylase/phosphopantothenate--cysteine ligase CoaBC [Eubacterium sp.]|nr:bifunctional phosphopantothenoylcysteine decarboxylase/phosphopantothenate--cysteine ligase CoaBC [Eubacterium sp.]